MTSRVKLSTYSLMLTIIVVAVMITAATLLFVNGERIGFIVAALLLAALISGIILAPVAIVADDRNIIVRSMWGSRKIPLSEIGSVELFKPTMGAIRIFASGGFMGYWGIFREGDIGRYKGYYGKASDCFLICMKNGDKYVLGCEHPEKMVNYITTHGYIKN